MESLYRRAFLPALVVFLVALAPMAGAVGMVRWDGQPENAIPSSAPQGSLLTPALGFYGDVIFTNAEFSYYDGSDMVELDGPRFKNWVGAKDGIITISFLEPYAVNEISIHVKGSGSLEAQYLTNSEYQTAAVRVSANDIALTAKDEYWTRLKFSPIESPRWQIILNGDVTVKDVILWGDGPFEPVTPIYPVREKFRIAYETLPGVDASTVSDHLYWAWRKPIIDDPKFKDLGAVWAQHGKWDRMAAAPVLPPKDSLNKTVSITMAQNEFEGALLTLTSLKDRIGEEIHDSGIYRDFHAGFQEFDVSVGDIKGPTPDKLKLTLRVAAMIPTQLWGVVPGPLFSADDKIGSALMMKYFTNGTMIADFPRIALGPCASQIFWLEAQTDGAAPGVYTAELTSSPGPSVPVRIEVLPVTLPTPRAWVHCWTRGVAATRWPYTDTDSLSITVADKLSRGISSYYGAPVPGSEAAEAYKQRSDVYFFYAYIVPSLIVGRGYGGDQEFFKNLSDDHRTQIAEHVKNVVTTFKSLGIDYSQWFGEMWDEPGDSNANLIKLCADLVHEVDPNVQVYSNPAFPRDVKNFEMMSSVSQIFVPFWANWFNGKEWLDENKSNRVNAFYGVQGGCRSELNEELVGHYRVMPWQSFILGLQGWGFYSYFSPRGDAYSDYEPAGSETDYQVVYPGRLGPVPSRQAEAFRDGWEDYRLLTLIESSDNAEAKKAMKEALDKIPMYREPLTGGAVDFEALRIELLRAAAEASK